jgi:hypothetical protein
MDFLLSGLLVPGGNKVVQLWQNLSPVTNTPPTAPTGLSTTVTTNGILLAWNAASDAQTPASGLSYNVRAGTTPGGNDLFSGNVDVSTGLHRVPQLLGNAQMNRFLPFNTANVPLGQPVYWSVQAIDTAFAGGTFAAESVFTNGFGLVSVPGLTAGQTAAWGDYDNDGRLDFLLTGTTPGGTNLIAAQADSGSGFRRVTARGNAEQRHFLPLVGVTNSQPIYWSVQSVDNNYAAAPPPDSQPSTLNLSWTPPTWGWLLQESPALAPSSWSNAPSGELNPVSVSATNPATFYRLTTP